jgi:hypothetical protein
MGNARKHERLRRCCASDGCVVRATHGSDVRDPGLTRRRTKWDRGGPDRDPAHLFVIYQLMRTTELLSMLRLTDGPQRMTYRARLVYKCDGLVTLN